MNDRRSQVLLAMQQALLGEVSSRLRAVIVSFDDTRIHFDCYLDGEILEEDRESMSLVESEVMAGFPESHAITHRVLRKDYPFPIEKEATWVFYRKED